MNHCAVEGCDKAAGTRGWCQMHYGMRCPSCAAPIPEDLTRRGFGIHPNCEPLNLSPDLVASDVFGIVAKGIANAPRSLQRRIGPSEVGTPCDRKLGHKLAGTPPVNERGTAWKPFIGTAVHEQLATMLAAAEMARFDDPEATPRWHIEERVVVGEIDGQEISGSCDLFDAHAGIVFDHKVVTGNAIRENYRPHGPGAQYRAQGHLYARGWQRAGFTVRHVAIIFWTRDREFTDRHVWHEPYDEAVAVAALERAHSIAVALRELGPAFTLPTLPVSAAHCRHCDWYAPNATDLARACPGVDATRPAPASVAEALT